MWELWEWGHCLLTKLYTLGPYVSSYSFMEKSAMHFQARRGHLPALNRCTIASFLGLGQDFQHLVLMRLALDIWSSHGHFLFSLESLVHSSRLTKFSCKLPIKVSGRRRTEIKGIGLFRKKKSKYMKFRYHWQRVLMSSFPRTVNKRGFQKRSGAFGRWLIANV